MGFRRFRGKAHRARVAVVQRACTHSNGGFGLVAAVANC